MTQKVRTRFAPSPTGHLHIGNARTAIMNWIFARHAGGQFILRVEDTDRERSTEASEQSILSDLAWLGLDWDEGPTTGGDCGPYRQSERLTLYKDQLAQMIEKGQAYPCYCTAEELETRRKEQLDRGESPQYNGRCRELSGTDKSRFEDDGREPAYRFKTESDAIPFSDLVRGSVTVPGDQLGDFIIARAGGMPMYNFACVVDDHSMQISHVIRGDDHVSNTPRQILIYRAFGWDVPIFAHTPMILGGDRQRLSKRHGATSVFQYKSAGYLPEALVNFLSLLSWSSESGDEILSIDRLVQEFDFARISKSAAVFDTEKLNWMNGQYIRALAPEDFSVRSYPFVQEAGFPVDNAQDLLPMAILLQEKVEKLAEVSEKIRFFFETSVIPETEENATMIQTEDSQKVFQAFLAESETLDDLGRQDFLSLMKRVQLASGVKGKNLWMPVRIALTGQEHGPDLPGIVEIFGIQKCRARIAQAIR